MTSERARATTGPRLYGVPDDTDDEARACILSSEARAKITAELPAALQLRDWVLSYSTEHHGCSLRTAYQRLASCGPNILMVLDAAGHRFGGFATESWIPGSRYSGTGESFLFKAAPGPPVVYHWTGSNSHFQLAYHDSIAMGGGCHFGLWLDEAFEFGSSGRCETYANAPLGSDESFRIIRAEVWSLAPEQTTAFFNDPSSPSPRWLSEQDIEMPPWELDENGRNLSNDPSSAFLVDLCAPTRSS